MNRVLALAVTLSTLALAAAGCESHDAAAATPDDHALCVQLMDKSRDCTADYIPALVDARAAADVPAGIAAQVKADRAGVIAQANQEWAKDSQDAAIDAQCNALPPLDADRDAARSCLAKTACGEFVGCAMPLFAKHFTK